MSGTIEILGGNTTVNRSTYGLGGDSNANGGEIVGGGVTVYL